MSIKRHRPLTPKEFFHHYALDELREINNLYSCPHCNMISLSACLRQGCLSYIADAKVAYNKWKNSI